MPITIASMMAVSPENLGAFAAALGPEDVEQLVGWLSLKEDAVRYRSFLLLQTSSRMDAGVYPFFDVFVQKLDSDNSYQRSLGVMLIAENARWDAGDKIPRILPAYLRILSDEKPITVRQCIQSLGVIAKASPACSQDIAKALLALDITQVRETMRKLVLFDIATVLSDIRKSYACHEIDEYLLLTLSGEILDKKSKKALEKLM